MEKLRPPATRTLPLGRSVAVWYARDWARLAAGDHVFVVGSYNSAEAVSVELASSPPATRTSPFPRRVAVKNPLGVLMEAAGDQGLIETAAAGPPPRKRNENTSDATPHTLRNRIPGSVSTVAPSPRQAAHG